MATYMAAKNKIKEFVRLPDGTCMINLYCIPDLDKQIKAKY